MSAHRSPDELDALTHLYDALLAASCVCEHQADGHDLEPVRERGPEWFRLAPCTRCACPGGRLGWPPAPRLYAIRKDNNP